MAGDRTLRTLVGAVALLALAGCGGSGNSAGALERSSDAEPSASSTPAVEPAEASSTTTTTAPPTTAPAPTEPPPTPTTAPAIERVLVSTGFAPYATAEGVVLHHPVDVVERVGFHESGHDGARHQEATGTAARPLTLETRDRGTGSQTAADIVVHPDGELRAPVTGTVIRGGSYTLYCDHTDEYLVIEPDGRPGWEVKLLHFEGLQVSTGDRVEGGVTVVGVRGRILPFESQVDEFTATPSWPHVHVEVVDPSIPDRPSPGGGC